MTDKRFDVLIALPKNRKNIIMDILQKVCYNRVRIFSSLTRRRKGTLIMEISTTSIRELPLSDQLFIQNIIDGKAIPPLYSDVVAKRIFNPDVHPDRLNFLMRRIAQDDTINVASS